MSQQPSQVAQAVKKLPANARDAGDAGPVPGLGRSPGGGHGNPLHYSCLENSMNRGACAFTVHRVSQNQTLLKLLSNSDYWSTCIILNTKNEIVGSFGNSTFVFLRNLHAVFHSG